MASRKYYVICVMSRDRVGIVADVAEAVLGLKGNVDAMSQTVMNGYFTIIFTASFPSSVRPEGIRKKIEDSGEPGELEVSIKPRDISAATEPVVDEDCDQFVLSIMGKDQPGVIARISGFLSSRHINIVDLYAYSERGSFTLISQLMVPRRLDVGQLQIDLENLWKESGLVVHLQHENIFLATNKVDFSGGA